MTNKDNQMAVSSKTNRKVRRGEEYETQIKDICVFMFKSNKLYLLSIARVFSVTKSRRKDVKFSCKLMEVF